MGTNQEIYNKAFYAQQREESRMSAVAACEYIVEIYKEIVDDSLNSIVDFGCGTGSWLSAFSDMNAEIEILGLDFGNPNSEQCYIDHRLIQKKDLSSRISLKKKYDICISLEVAEHISKECAEIFVDNLVNASDFIVFSAAIPGQGGDSHINEQRQSYWKKLFNKRGYIAIDLFRRSAWNDNRIKVWYRQNTIIYVRRDVISVGKREEVIKEQERIIFDTVHPDMFINIVDKYENISKRFINGVFIEKNMPWLSKIIKLIRYGRPY